MSAVVQARRSARRRGRLIVRALVTADLASFALAFVLAELLFKPSGAAVDSVATRTEYVLFVLALPAWIAIGRVYGLYRDDEEKVDHSSVDDVPRVVGLVTFAAWGFWLAASFSGLASPLPSKLVTFWVLAIALVTTGRVFARSLCRRRPAFVQNVVIVGAGDVGQRLARKVRLHDEYRLRVVGFLDRQPAERHRDLDDLRVLGTPDQLAQVVEKFDVDRVIIAFSNAESHQETLDLVRKLKELDVHIDIVPRLFEVLTPGAHAFTVEGVPLMGLRPPRLSKTALLTKRALDVALSSVALFLLAPAFLLIAIIIKLDSRGPVFFRQLRMGHRDRPFHIYKFRTMAVDAELRKAELEHLNRHAGNGQGPRLFKIEADPRVTRVGRFLRARAIDELPQIINVLRGEMSVVGPRPLVLPEDRHVFAWARKRLDIKPGMTGLWQVLGGSRAIAFDEMLALDHLYVTSWSLWLDCSLIARTVPLVLKGSQGNY